MQGDFIYGLVGWLAVVCSGAQYVAYPLLIEEAHTNEHFASAVIFTFYVGYFLT